MNVNNLGPVVGPNGTPFFISVGLLSDQIMEIIYQITYPFSHFLVISLLIRSIYEQKLSDDLLSDQIEEINIVRSLLFPIITEKKYFGGR